MKVMTEIRIFAIEEGERKDICIIVIDALRDGGWAGSDIVIDEDTRLTGFLYKPMIVKILRSGERWQR